MSADGPKILIVGVGNVLHGDDGFGVQLAWRLAKQSFPAGVTVMETGIGGMSIVQELMTGYDAVLLLDAHQSGGQHGELRLLQPVLPDLSALDVHALRDYFADTHYATPIRALSLLEHLGRLPPRIAIIGCEPAEIEEFGMGLSAPVAAALDKAVGMARDWVADQFNVAVTASQALVEESAPDRRLYLIVGKHQISPCNHEMFQRFKLEVAQMLVKSTLDAYRATGVTVRHWDERGREIFPLLLGRCDFGTYLPVDDGDDTGSIAASAPQLLRELEQVVVHRAAMQPEHRDLLHALIHMTQQSIERNVPLEIR